MWKKLTALYALTATACASWQTQRGPAPHVVEESGKKGEQAIQVELKSGARFEIFGATLVGDSIIGRNTRANNPETQRVAVATSDVRSIARHTISAGRTAIAVVAIAAAIVVLAGAGGSSDASSTSNSSCAA